MDTNIHAGKDLISYVRSLDLDAIPVLLFSTSGTLPSAEFIQHNAPAGSTMWYKIVLDYINGLVGSTSMNWAKANADVEKVVEEPEEDGSDAISQQVTGLSISQ
jgi:hypothetical protein